MFYQPLMCRFLEFKLIDDVLNLPERRAEYLSAIDQLDKPHSIMKFLQEGHL